MIKRNQIAMGMSMDVLYHGSSIYVDELIPQQAFDWGYEEGCKHAVYATSNKNQVLAFALGSIPDNEGNVERIMEPKYGDQMVFWKGTPNYHGVGYLYILSAERFIHAGGSQWISKQIIKPLEIVKINVDDYLHLFRFATKEEKDELCLLYEDSYHKKSI